MQKQATILIDLTLQNYQFIALSFGIDKSDNELYYVINPMAL